MEVTLQIGAVKCQPRCERSQKVKSGNARCQNLVAGVTRLYAAKLLNLKHGLGTKTDLNYKLRGRYHILKSELQCKVIIIDVINTIISIIIAQEKSSMQSNLYHVVQMDFCPLVDIKNQFKWCSIQWTNFSMFAGLNSSRGQHIEKWGWGAHCCYRFNE